jgi:hypothetical protein
MQPKYIVKMDHQDRSRYIFHMDADAPVTPEPIDPTSSPSPARAH